MSALLLAIKKLVAILTAFFIPTTVTAPAVLPQHSRAVGVAVFQNIENNENTDLEIVEQKEVPPEEGTPEIIDDEEHVIDEKKAAVPRMAIVEEEEAGDLTEIEVPDANDLP